MKAKLLFVLMLFTLFCNGQILQKVNTYGYEYKRFLADTLLGIPGDTLSVPTNLKTFPWLARKGSLLYMWNTNKWEGAGSSIDTSNKWVNMISRVAGKDSIIFYIGSTRYAIKDSTGNLSGYVPTSRTITINGTALDLSANRSWSVGTVTSVGSGWGTNFSAITSTGSVVIDSTSGGVTSWVRTKKIVDSLVSAGWGSTTGKLNISDTSSMLTNYLRGATAGFGISISGTQHKTWSADTTSGGVQSWVRGKKIIDSLSAAGWAQQTITLSGDVTGSGTGSFATTIANNAVTFAKFVQGGANTVVTNPTAGTADFTTTALSASNLLGRGSTGNISAIKLGTNLSFSNDTLNATGGGGISLAAIGSTPNANAATLTGSVLNLEPASASFGGVVTTGTQTFAGDKTFNGQIKGLGKAVIGAGSGAAGVSLADGNLTSTQSSALNLYGYGAQNEWIGFGQYYDGLWKPTSTSAFQIYHTGTNLDIFGNSGLTANVSYTPTRIGRIKANGNVGYGDIDPVNRLSLATPADDVIPALGVNGGKFGLFGPANAYGMIMGELVTGNGYIQVQRIDATATAYNLLLQPSGGEVQIRSTTDAGDYTLQITGGTYANITGKTWSVQGMVYNSGASLVALAIDTLTGLIYRKTAGGGGSVTSVAAGWGTSFTTITTTGSVIVDSTSGGVTSWVRTKKIVDSLVSAGWAQQTITLTSDVTGSGTGSFATTIANDVVTYAKMQNVSATSRIMGRITAGAGDMEELTGTQATTLLDLFSTTTTTKGLVPGSNNVGATYFLRADGTWAVPAGGGDMVLASAQTNSGAKTFLDATLLLRNVANTFSGKFTNTITADRTYTLKDASGTLAFVSDITGTNSGTNTGDQNLFSSIPVSGQTTVTANSTTTALTFVAGTNMTITTDNTAKSITFNSPTKGIDDVLDVNQAIVGSATFNASTGGGQNIYFNMYPGVPVVFQTNSALTNTTSSVTSEWHTTTGVAAAGFGLARSVDLETSNGSSLGASRFTTTWTDATTATATSQYVIGLYNSGAQETNFTLSGNGRVWLNKYGVNSFTGTAAYWLAVTSTGQLIEMAAPGGGGLGDPGGNGVVVRTALNTTINRTLTGTTNRITITNGDGVSGNPTFDIGTDVVTLTGSQTLTNKRITSRTGTTTSSATPTINTDNVDFYSLTAQAVDITSFTTNLSGTPTEAQKLWIAITGTATRNITWGTSFEGTLLPTATNGTNRLDVGFVWNTVTSKWRCVAVQ